MNLRFPCRTAVTVMALVALLNSNATALPAAGRASGMFTAGSSKPIKLRYAYAQLQKSDDAPAKQEILLLLSDVPLDDETRDDWAALSQGTRKGILHAVALILNPDDKTPVSANLYHQAFRGSMSLSGSTRFIPTIFTKTVLAGRAYVPPTKDFEGRPLAFDATFRTTIRPLVAPTFVGTAARNSAPAKAALAFFAACRKGDVAAIRTFLPPEQSAELDGPKGKQMLEVVKMMAPDPTTSRVASVNLRGNVATVVIEEKKSSGKETTTLKLVGATPNGPWKVTP
jgi:hypothetical protein